MYVWILSLCVVGAAFLVQQFANQLDEQLNACGTGTYKDGACECVHPYTGTHCEIVNCGYGKLVDSVLAYDTITTPKGPSGCACEDQYWGYNCDVCTSKVPCTGPCRQNYYGTRCEILCKESTAQDSEGVQHELSGGVYNYVVPDRGFCLQHGSPGTVECKEGFAGEHCQYVCPDCVYGSCSDTGTCDCFDGYAGELCDLTCPNRCSGLNGLCTEVDDAPVCECYPGFTGDDCSLECCVNGRGTDLGTVHGTCRATGGCDCKAESIPAPVAYDLEYNGVGWQGAECDCHENVTCGGRGVCGAEGCECAPQFQGARCDVCADDKIGPFCEYDRWQCPSAEDSHGEFVPINSRGDYACKCNVGFEGEHCESCTSTAYPKSDTDTGVDMCTFIIPDRLCHTGTVRPSYDGTGDTCQCPPGFDVVKDCASCYAPWYGPECTIKCSDACRESGGVCSNAGPGCVCPKGRSVEDGPDGQVCVSCSGDDCNHGECIDGQCRCDPGYYGDKCDITPPVYNDKVCNGYAHVVEEELGTLCRTDAECMSSNTPAAKRAELYGRTLFCHREDTPDALKSVEGCCVESNGFCNASLLTASPCEYVNEVGNTVEGDVVSDVCNKRALEGEVNVYEWCLAENCTKNGFCADPEFCADRCDAGLTPSEWEARWLFDHTRTMSDVMSEPWKFSSVPDPYPFRASYVSAEIEDVCPLTEYRTCRDHLIPDAAVYNLTHVYLGEWQLLPNYHLCGDVTYISREVDGVLNVSVDLMWAGSIETLGPNTAAYGRLNGGDEAYAGGSMIDALTLYGRGKVEVVIYNASDFCRDFVRRAAPDYAACKDVKFYELDYDWTEFCATRQSTGTGGFNDTCYRQSKVCAGCENYEPGCEGLPLHSEYPSPMPAPCDVGWEDFCPSYLANELQNGTCAYAKCDCEGYGVGGEACNLQCPVLQYGRSELSCGAGEVVPMGECRSVGNGAVLGYEQGECYCFNRGDPSKGCALVCDGEQDCSQDVDTPFEFDAPNCSKFLDLVDSNGTCKVNLRDSTCNYYRGRCECATPFTLVNHENQSVYMNPFRSYRVALMQGYDIYEYLNFTTYTGTPPTDLIEAFDDLDPNFKCFKDLEHTEEVPCDWIRALKHFARGGSYRIGDCHNLAPGTNLTTQVPCSGHGFPQAGTCACDYAEQFELRSSGVGLVFEQPGLTQTPWRGKGCAFLCPGYDMQSMDSVCSGHGLCESDGRCSCDQGWTGYKCDLSCEQTQEVLTCSGHGTCDERLYRRAGSQVDDLSKTFDSNCVNESMYLSRDRVVSKDGVVYHMYENLGLKVHEYPGGVRDATVEDYFILGTAVRHPFGFESDVPFMPCKDTLLVKREEAVLPIWAGTGTPDVFISCNVLPGYEVRCGQCTCEETSQTGHWTGHDCRTPALGHFGKDARRKCPGMVDGKPCNGGGTCMWGSDDGLGLVFREAPSCFCGDTSVNTTLATAPRTGNNQWIVHAMNGEDALYRKVVDSVPKDSDCPAGTEEQGGVCVPLRLALENYNDDCSCKFGFTGTTCETPRMMCLFDGEETDGTTCICTDNNGEPNEKVNAKGCCTKGTYWDQERYRSLQLLTDFVVLEDNPLYTSSFLHVCSPVADDIPEAEAIFHQHNYIVTTDEYILEETVCSESQEKPLAVAIPRHPAPLYYELKHKGECEQNDGWESGEPGGVASVEACAAACQGKKIGYKLVLGFVFQPGSCWCEANPSHPAEDCGLDPSNPDDYMRYDFIEVEHTVPLNADPVQWCMQQCDAGFVLEGSECSCRDSLAFVGGDQTVFSAGLMGNGMRYDIVHPSSDCYKMQSGELVRPEKFDNKRYLEPSRFLRLENVSLTDGSTVEECFAACTNAFTFGDFVTDTETEVTYNFPEGGKERVATDSPYYRESLVDECAARCTAENYELGFIVGVGGAYLDCCYCRGGDETATLDSIIEMIDVYKFVSSSQCICGDPLPPFYEVAHQGECEKNDGWESSEPSGAASVDACANACFGTMTVMNMPTYTFKSAGMWKKYVDAPDGNGRVALSSKLHRSNLADECAARCVYAGFVEGFMLGKAGDTNQNCYCKINGVDDTSSSGYDTTYFDIYDINEDTSTREVRALGFVFKPGSCWCEANPSHPDPDCQWLHPGDSYMRYDFVGETKSQVSNGYIIREYEDNVYRHTDFTTPYKNPKPCEIDTYLSYPEMDKDCHCPIFHFEESMVKDDALVYSISLDDDRANLHSCIEECTTLKKRTARVELAQNFTCFCGDTYAEDGVAGYKLSHTRFARAEFEGGACTGDLVMITDPEECKLAAEIIGNMPTELQYPSVLPNSYCTESAQEYGGDASFCAREGCGHYTHGELDYLIMGYHTKAYNRPQYSTQLCKHKQECKCPGFYMRGGHAYSCKAGTYSDGVCSSRCKACPVGRWSEEGATSCEFCAAGKIQVSEKTCLNCPEGFFSSEGDSQCTECPTGKFSSVGAEICSDCPDGKTSSNDKVSTCVDCAAGKFSTNGATCKDCAAGTYSGAVAASCTTCPDGWAQSSVGTTACYKCTAGSFSNPPSNGCNACAAGKFSSEGQNACSSCPVGYKSSSGQSSCAGCSDSEYQDEEGQSSCKSCGTIFNLFLGQPAFKWQPGAYKKSFSDCVQVRDCPATNQDWVKDCSKVMAFSIPGHGAEIQTCCNYQDNAFTVKLDVPLSSSNCKSDYWEFKYGTNYWIRKDSGQDGISFCQPFY